MSLISWKHPEWTKPFHFSPWIKVLLIGLVLHSLKLSIAWSGVLFEFNNVENQAEAEVVTSSSSVEVKVEIAVEVKVKVKLS